MPPICRLSASSLWPVTPSWLTGRPESRDWAEMAAALSLPVSREQKGQEPPQIAACCHPPNPNPVYPELAEAPWVGLPRRGQVGSPVLPHAAQCPEGGCAANKGERCWKEREGRIILTRRCELRWARGQVACLSGGTSPPWGNSPHPRGSSIGLCSAVVRHGAGAGQSWRPPLSAHPSSQLGFPSYKAGTSPIPYLPRGTLSRSEIMSALAQPSTEGGSF